MIRTSIVWFVIAALVGGCGSAMDSNRESETWHIFSAEEARLVSMPCSRPSPGPVSNTWEPSDALVAEIESQLRTMLQEQIDSNHYPVNADSTEYSFQIAGLIIDEQKVLYFNGIRTGFLYDDLSEPIDFCDGGAVAFGVEYVVPEQTFRNFHFNRVA